MRTAGRLRRVRADVDLHEGAAEAGGLAGLRSEQRDRTQRQPDRGADQRHPERQADRVAHESRKAEPAGDIIANLESEVLPEIQRTYPDVQYSFEGQQAEQRDTMQGLFRGFALANSPRVTSRSTCGRSTLISDNYFGRRDDNYFVRSG